MDRKQVLVIDDDMDVAHTIGEFLDTIDLNYIIAKDGKEGFLEFTRNGIDLVITDIKMPVDSGISFAKKIRALGYQTPIIFMTGFGSAEVEKSIKGLGAYDFIMKPFEGEDLTYVVTEALAELTDNS